MTYKRYTIGFVASVLLTAASFAIVAEHLATQHQFPSHGALFAGIVVLALAQLAVQMIYFLHVGESKSRDIAVLALAAAIVVLVVGGSLWIMANLQDNTGVPYQNGVIVPQAETD